MASSWIVEAVDVFEDGDLSLPSVVPCVPPDQFSFDGFEEGLDGGVIVTIALAAHRYLEAMLTQDLLIIVRTILAATVGMMDAALGRCPEGDGHL